MNGRKIAGTAVDVGLAAVFVGMMATALVQEAPHEYLGMTLFALALAHIVLNRRQLGAMTRGRMTALRVLQVVVLAGLIACIVGQVASSLIISKHALGFLPAFPGAWWARRMHILCSYWSFIFAFAHVGLHVRTPKGLATWQLWAIRAAWAAVACFGAYSFVQLGVLPYLLGQVQFAAADYEAPLALSYVRFASIAALVAGLFHYVRVALQRQSASSTRRKEALEGGLPLSQRTDGHRTAHPGARRPNALAILIVLAMVVIVAITLATAQNSTPQDFEATGPSQDWTAG